MRVVNITRDGGSSRERPCKLRAYPVNERVRPSAEQRTLREELYRVLPDVKPSRAEFGFGFAVKKPMKLAERFVRQLRAVYRNKRGDNNERGKERNAALLPPRAPENNRRANNHSERKPQNRSGNFAEKNYHDGKYRGKERKEARRSPLIPSADEQNRRGEAENRRIQPRVAA